MLSVIVSKVLIAVFTQIVQLTLQHKPSSKIDTSNLLLSIAKALYSSLFTSLHNLCGYSLSKRSQ